MGDFDLDDKPDLVTANLDSINVTILLQHPGLLDYDDDDPCTVDSCEPASGCVHDQPEDADADGYCFNDNWPSVANPLQLDTDSDLVGDACDAEPADPGNAALLGPARNLDVATETDLAWDPPADGDPPLSYDLLRADGAGDWTSPACVETDTSATTASDGETPDPGAAFFNLVRVKNA